MHKNGVYKLKRENAQRASKVINGNKSEAMKCARDFIKNCGFQEERTYPRSSDPTKTKG